MSNSKAQMSDEHKFILDNAEWLADWFQRVEQVSEPEKGFQRFVYAVDMDVPIQLSITRAELKVIQALVFSRDVSNNKEFDPLTGTAKGFVAQKDRLPVKADKVRLRATEWFRPEWDPKRRIYLITTVGIQAL